MRMLFAAAGLFVAHSAFAAPIATPVQSITDPSSLTSPTNPNARPVPLGDLSAVRGATGAAWAPDGKSLVIGSNLTGRYNLWRVDLGRNFPVQLTTSDESQQPALVTPDGQIMFRQD